MKPRQIELIFIFLTLATVTMTKTTATPIPAKDSTTSRNEMAEENAQERVARGEKVIGTCLRIAPNLPPCNFDAEATWRSRSGEILHGNNPAAGSGYQSIGELPDFNTDGSGEKILTGESVEQKDATSILTGEKNLEGFDFCENDLAITVVYYLEGCLPARLPFDLPSCPIDELQTIQMNTLIPFQLPDVQDALIFPEIDVKQIEFSHRQSRAPSPRPSASQSHEESEEGRSSGKRARVFDRSSSFLTENGNGNGNGLTIGALAKDLQDFHKIILKSSMTAKTGTASKKYVSMPQGSGSTTGSMGSSGPSWISRKNRSVDRRSFRVAKTQEKSSLDDRHKSVHGTRQTSDTLVKEKNRVQ